MDDKKVYLTKPLRLSPTPMRQIPSTSAARNSRSTILSRCQRAVFYNSALNYMKFVYPHEGI